MLKPSRIQTTPTSQALVQHWANRYRTDLQQFSKTSDPLVLEQYITAAYPENRTQTALRIKRSLHLYCELGAINAVALFSISANFVNLNEARRLAIYVEAVYQEILTLYAQQASSLTLSAPLPVEDLSDMMETQLLQLQEQHQIAKDARTIGFLTTQFHFTTLAVLRTCTPYERVWLKPYFQFVEEQVGIPWQRICAAAQEHDPESPLFQVVAALIPLSQTIAKRVHRRAVEQFPEHRSRRGTLNTPKVAASSLRDLVMFQGYLCLCLLERNLEAIATELLPLCQLVFPSIEVQWELVEYGIDLLIQEIHAVLPEDQQRLIQPYTSIMGGLFIRSSSPTDDDEFEELDTLDEIDSLDEDEDITDLIDLSVMEDLEQSFRHFLNIQT
ncbi:MAG: hypothetical protein MUF49_28615 [Oculatellaceae cyanobacterium Prado106]|jgi:hypothetical protein|nr:hypothetical protein [Oculatellaceae cyanobacterium Prado106]